MSADIRDYLFKVIIYVSDLLVNCNILLVVSVGNIPVSYHHVNVKTQGSGVAY